MKTHWINCLTGGATHQLLLEQFTLRKRVFIDNLGWKLSTKGHAEVDQYDTPYASYCLVENAGKLVASARVLPTDVELGGTSYMIRDASLGRLGSDLPPHLCSNFKPPVSAKVWEATRLAVDPTLSKPEKKIALKATVRRMIQEAGRVGVLELLAIGGIELTLGVRSAGYQIERVTPFHTTISGKIAVFRMPVSIYKLTPPSINGNSESSYDGGQHDQNGAETPFHN